MGAALHPPPYIDILGIALKNKKLRDRVLFETYALLNFTVSIEELGHEKGGTR